jgi:SAM-dependent methyltransferase
MAEMTDLYAKGMIASGEEHFDLTPELDEFQYRMVRPYLHGSILEVGAGPGRIARLLLEDQGLSFDRYVISEPSDHFFGQLNGRVRTSATTHLVQHTTAELVGQYQGAFDTIFSVHVLEHVEDDRGFIEDCLAMLKPGGKVVILVPALQSLYSDLDQAIGHYRRYDKRMVRRLIAGLDCQLIELYYTNFLAVFASFIFFKLLHIDYQKSEANKSRFIFLERIYSRYFIPIIDLMERHVPMPMGLNLTFVLGTHTLTEILDGGRGRNAMEHGS